MDKIDFQNQKQAFNFLTEIYEVMKCFDKNTPKLNNKVNELKTKFEKAKSTLNTVNGIEMSNVEQQEYYESLLKQYKLKVELLDSYKQMCTFEINKVDDNDELAANTSINMKDATMDTASAASAGVLTNEDLNDNLVNQNILTNDNLSLNSEFMNTSHDITDIAFDQ